MAGSANPGYNPDMQSLPINDSAETQSESTPNMDWAAPIPAEPAPIVDALIGDHTPPGNAFTRVVSNNGESDVADRG